ncbi:MULTISPECIES: lipid IV(A) 4-amino-4-deoxy-L-arabinosyltransferase [unclassified Pseudomonas]|jgi:4-amino-4-deoxy-L-arabinose transferase|uniref:lipid IV(A) 4-amino-4-deoxy-L-arabinosyltransferase n=1 Tax=unclassified Pseudomonas TaxID=196821 RepID=UPI000C86CC31|nr:MULTISPECIES: lipid IV(A) 4-amino-4-deoxy-L-arabinosyltransferase [unclassified Pseudomonas]MDO8404291.1 lipid IV(A) 4-amino-4-deoxy-L-arabinosyltransferase [Pseudomonas sp.]PMV88482.1 lipid IV(A) 4-amino-4-deoxy-L-arabinosyltransferase [Pseudomonas sp. GW101-1A09]PMV91536.1 lipid IV(A) 4-amino-4-deoxy-L-arabinosyltransferase [Pseudomonas sp. FW306-2-2C-B10A]PMV99916.1 lipid IV(A) 4-amino-4-deoxy-L-arabinosyltransferase [Pseudomonas sp. MPR-TSA4]PMW02777.1 lipid IV(A) 4-amino-4-deoxy-L-arab
MSKRWGLPLLLGFFLLAYLLPLGSHGLWIPDETRYAQISQGMLLSGDWVSPHFMGLRYFEKPAAGYWVIAASQALFGQNLFGVRFASALSMGLSVLLCFLIARRLWNEPRKSFACALLYMSFTVVAGQAGYANLDPQFTFWVNLSLVALWFALDSDRRGPRLTGWAVLGLACGMGFMTKGFLAWLLPVLIALPFMIWQKRWRELLVYGPVAIIVAIAVSLPWALAIHSQQPDYWRFFFWHEHIRRFAGDDAQHDAPWWFYLPLLVAFSLPWVALLPSALRQAWTTRGQVRIGFLLLWLVMPLLFFSLSNGKLPSYILPCLLPLALLLGHTLADRLKLEQGRVLGLNGLLNLLLGLTALLALVYLQLKKPLYNHELHNLVLVFIGLIGWIMANLLQAFRPLQCWAAPAFGSLLLIGLLPAGLPDSVVANKMPDQFIRHHADELAQTGKLLSNDLGAAAALAWRLKRPDVALYNTIGELKYGLAYPDSVQQRVDPDQVQQWMRNARQSGSVGVVMRVKGEDELQEIERLPKDGKRYEQGNLVILIFPQGAS